ncbi:MAG: guanylate kinase [Ruminococcaceae bacterium]|nr:guanylate kinase [Oscillospiraceae bacterium]
MAKGLLIVYAGASGVGKGTIMKQLLNSDSNFRLSVSATTRAPRPGEIDGVHYSFVTKDEFQKLINNDGLLEYANYCGNFYGTPRKAVYDMLDAGIDVFLEIEIKGFLQIKEKYPECVTIFLLPPSIDELERRLVGRGTEEYDVIKKRLQAAKEELTYADQFDYTVINDDVNRATKEVLDIISNIKKERNKEN